GSTSGTSTGTTGIVSGTTYAIIARNSGKALDVVSKSTAEGANIQQWTYYATPNQRWVVTYLGNGYYKIKSVNSGRLVSLSSKNYSADGDNVLQLADFNSDTQLWQIADVGNGYYKIINKYSGKGLDVQGGTSSTGNGVNVQQWTYFATTNQQWQFKK
ncbi:MAG TPA: RICIN domain-containing protein, partial [Bacteroidales bacterium]